MACEKNKRTHIGNAAPCAHQVVGSLKWRCICSLMEEKACPGVCSCSGTSAVVDFIDTRAAMALPSISRMVPPSTSSSTANKTYSRDFMMFKVVKRPLTWKNKKSEKVKNKNLKKVDRLHHVSSRQTRVHRKKNKSEQIMALVYLLYKVTV